VTGSRAKLTLLSTLALTALAAGCAVGPDEAAAPGVRAPVKFAEAKETPGVAASDPAPDYAFWRGLGDPVLASLVERALRASPDAALAAARVREARSLAGVASAALFPALDMQQSYRRIRASTEAPGLSGGISDLPGFDRDQSEFTESLSMAYEVDIWGKRRREREAAEADLAEAIERRRATGLSLAGEVASTVLEHRALVRRRAIALDAVAARRTALALAESRLAAGIGMDLDVARARGELAFTAAAVPELERLASQAEHRLSVLLGRPPGSLRAELAVTPPSPHASVEPVPLGLPASLVARRPDVRAAARRLAAATARIGAAKADLFPQVTLSGEVGLQATDMGKLASSAAGFWSFGPSLRVPLFDAGRRKDLWDAAEARADQELRSLEKAILTALEETEGALASLRQESRRREILSDAVLANERAAEIARARYETGTAAYIEVLDADRALLDAQDALAESERLVSLARVRLGKAVAGGLVEEGLLPPVDAPESA